MDELVNISNYCNALLIIYGQQMTQCIATYIRDDDVIEFRIKYHVDRNRNIRTFQYIIQNFNFAITDSEVLVNRSVIDSINKEIDNRINQKTMKYAI
jgi:hypothetical protein